MPIEFRCPQCQKLLRTPDDTAGKNARCPECEAVVAVPGGSIDSPEPDAGGLLSPSVPGLEEENPFRSPTQSGYVPPQDSLERDGPPWEREGVGVESAWHTIRLGYSDTRQFFGSMRREGGHWQPLLFATLVTLGGAIASFLYQLVWLVVMDILPNVDPLVLGRTVGGLACYFVLVPLGLYITSGISHVVLLILQGANFPFETTLRAASYATGIGGVFSLIPFVGQYLAMISVTVFMCIGLTKLHETSGWKGTIAGLAPITLCIAISATSVILVYRQLGLI